ncbi:oral-facial-digital syndrome 1 protein homolog isoform X2 [Agrilus planipennis]|uniref:Oral-facial-digital syndrome 1 protein homolog isoform X2 n=1 Tax=Agrilus planipennis TaxID=224129 RepID=A0A1W4XTS1_AGRPL|nr:oral-facial-digital syndrome 1 protein homolog isoform X2 [Agrilus planipennis]
MDFRPAMPAENETTKELTVADFQKALFEWYNRRGLLSDLRAHLRTQMVSALKDTSIEQCFTSKNISPKMQAINLLIAEFLMLYNYHYSLSVFSTEVPFANALNYVNTEKADHHKAFDEHDAIDILETVGISQNTKEGPIILKKYMANNSEPLLMHILKYLIHKLESVSVSNVNMKLKELADNIDKSKWEDAFNEFFVSCDLDEENSKKLICLIENVFEKEINEIKKAHRLEMDRMRSVFEEKEILLMEELNNEKSKWETEFKSLKQKLNVVRQRELQTLHRHVTHLAEFEKTLKIKQEDLLNQQKNIEDKEHRLNASFRRLQEERKEMHEIKEKLIEEKKTASKVRKLLEKERLLNNNECPMVKPIKSSSSQEGNTELKQDSSKLLNLLYSKDEVEDIAKKNEKPPTVKHEKEQKKIIDKLKTENKKMQSEIVKQKEKIQELSFKISNLILNTKGIVVPCLANSGDHKQEHGKKIHGDETLESVFVSKKHPEDDNMSEQVINVAREYLNQIKCDNVQVNNNYQQIMSMFNTAKMQNK